MALKKGTEIATIDVCLVTITTKGDSPVEIALKTSNQVQVSPATETTEAVKLIIKGELIAQKGEEVTITGNAITLTDNVFNPEVAKILQNQEKPLPLIFSGKYQRSFVRAQEYKENPHLAALPCNLLHI